MKRAAARAGVLLALVAGLTWLAGDAGQPDRCSSGCSLQPPSVSPPLSLALVPPQPSAAGAAAGAGIASSALQAGAEVERTLPAGGPPPGFIDLCGGGRVSRADLAVDGSPAFMAWMAEMNRQSQEGMAAVLRRLDAGPPVQRVAAAVLRGDPESAATLAVGLTDPRAYRLALQVCRRDRALRAARSRLTAQPRVVNLEGAASAPDLPPVAPVQPTACEALSLERLESLDPTDAWPALARLTDAREAQDEAAVAQALFEMAQRTWASRPVGDLPAVVSEVVGPDPTPDEVLTLVTAAGMGAMSILDGSLTSINRACQADALRDANRRQLCEAVARRMPAFTQDLLDARMLHLLEARLGLPHSAKALSQEATSRARELLAGPAQGWMAEPSCDRFAAAGRHLGAVARQGELAAVRALELGASAPARH